VWGHHYFSNILILNDKRILRGARVVHIGASDAVWPKKRGTLAPYFHDANAVILTPQWTRINWRWITLRLKVAIRNITSAGLTGEIL